MAKIRKVPVSETEYQCQFMCPGCECLHAFNDATWEFNGDITKPTLRPSFLTHGGRPKPGNGLPHDTEIFRCHSFIKDGMIEFLSDCTHKLASQTIELPEVE